MYPVVVLPAITDVISGVDPENVTDDQDRFWNAHCTAIVRAALEQSPYVRTHYPYDLPDGSSDDTVTLDDDGEIVIVDEGAPL